MIFLETQQSLEIVNSLAQCYLGFCYIVWHKEAWTSGNSKVAQFITWLPTTCFKQQLKMRIKKLNRTQTKT